MAFASDIENALARIAAETLVAGDYRFGDVVPSTVGPSVRIYRGWPIANVLDADMAALRPTSQNPGLPIVHVSIYTRPGTAQTSRYLDVWRKGPVQPPTLTVAVDHQSIVLSGVPSSHSVVGCTVHGRNYSYRPTALDTIEAVASSLADLIPDAYAVGGRIQLPEVPAYVGSLMDSLMYREVRRQTEGFLITVWAPTPDTRDLVAPVLDQAYAEIRCLALPDGSGTSPVGSNGVVQSDQTGKSRIWRADILLNINYATTITEWQPRAMFPQAIIN